MLILIHGQHSQDASDQNPEHPDLPASLPEVWDRLKIDGKERWSNFLSAFAAEPGMDGKFDVWRYVYDNRNLHLQQCSDQLNEQLRRANSANLPVVILAHSYGGLVGRRFLYDHDDEWSILRLITLATPHLGSPGADILIQSDRNVNRSVVRGLEAFGDLLLGPFELTPLNWLASRLEINPDGPIEQLNTAFREQDWLTVTDTVELTAYNVRAADGGYDLGYKYLMWDARSAGTSRPSLTGVTPLRTSEIPFLWANNHDYDGDLYTHLNHVDISPYVDRILFYTGGLESPEVPDSIPWGALLGAGLWGDPDGESTMLNVFHTIIASMGSPFLVNDGMAPKFSSIMGSASVPTSQIRDFSVDGLTSGATGGYDHREMVEGKERLGDPLFASILKDLSDAVEPAITAILPSVGPGARSTVVTLRGVGFGRVPGTVTFGRTGALSYSQWTEHEVVCLAPPQASVTVRVTVDTSDGNHIEAASGFTYGPGEQLPDPTPDAPGGIRWTETTSTDAGITAVWDAVDGAIKYHLQIAEGTPDFAGSLQFDSGWFDPRTSHVFAAPEDGTYYFRIQTFNGDRQSDWSDPSDAVTVSITPLDDTFFTGRPYSSSDRAGDEEQQPTFVVGAYEVDVRTADVPNNNIGVEVRRNGAVTDRLVMNPYQLYMADNHQLALFATNISRWIEMYICVRSTNHLLDSTAIRVDAGQGSTVRVRLQSAGLNAVTDSLFVGGPARRWITSPATIDHTYSSELNYDSPSLQFSYVLSPPESESEQSAGMWVVLETGDPSFLGRLFGGREAHITQNITVSVTPQVWPPPRIYPRIPDVTAAAGQPIVLDLASYKHDDRDALSDLIWAVADAGGLSPTVAGNIIEFPPPPGGAGSARVSVALTNSHGGTASQAVELAWTAPDLVAAFTHSIDGTMVSFRDMSSGEPDSWLWDFGDGEVSTEPDPTHTYSDLSAYAVTLTVGRGQVSHSASARVLLDPDLPTIASISESVIGLRRPVTITGYGARAGDTVQVMLAAARNNNSFEDADPDTSQPVTITAGGVADSSGAFEVTFQVENRIFRQARTQVRLKVVSVSAETQSYWFGSEADIVDGMQVVTTGLRLSLDETSGPGDAILTLTGIAADDSGNALPSANIGSITLQHQFVSGGSLVVVPATDLTVNVGLKEGDTVRTDSFGRFEVTFRIATTEVPSWAAELIGLEPTAAPLPGGLLTISIAGERISYTITPTLAVVGPDGAATAELLLGETYTLDGAGYFPQQAVAVTFGGEPLDTSSATTTDRFGRFGTTFATPDVLGGPHLLSGADAFSGTSTTLVVVGTITIPTETLQPVVRGDVVEVSGIGFGAAEEIAFAVGPATIAAEHVTDGVTAADGTFSSTITIPAVAAGEHDLVVSSQSSRAILTGAFTISSSVMANPAKSKVGADLTISGSGWPASDEVTIQIAGENPVTTTTDHIGTFSTTITLADEKADGSVVTASATSSGMLETTTFTYDGSAAARDVTVVPTTAVSVDGVITVAANIEAGATATFSIAGVVAATAVAMTVTGDDAPDGFAAVAGSHTATAGEEATDAAVTVVVTDALGNVDTYTPDGTVTIQVNPEASFTVSLHTGVNLLHVPLRVAELDRASALYSYLGGSDSVSALVTLNDDGEFVAVTAATGVGSPSDLTLDDHTGVIAVMSGAKQVTFEGTRLAISAPLRRGLNMIGVPRAGVISQVSEIAERSDHVRLVIREEKGQFFAVPPYDARVEGGRSYIVPSARATTLDFEGEAWANTAAAAPALTVTTVGEQTPIVVVSGQVGQHVDGDTEGQLSVVVTHTQSGDTVETPLGRHGVRNTFSAVVADLLGEGYTSGDVLDIRVVRSGQGNEEVARRRHVITADEIRSSLVDVGLIDMHRVPVETSLLRNFPNPFNPETWIPFALSEDATVTITIYDVAGRRVRAIPLGWLPEGTYSSRSSSAYWDGRNDQGEAVSSGVYWYRLDAAAFSSTRRMLLLK